MLSPMVGKVVFFSGMFQQTLHRIVFEIKYLIEMTYIHVFVIRLSAGKTHILHNIRIQYTGGFRMYPTDFN